MMFFPDYAFTNVQGKKTRYQTLKVLLSVLLIFFYLFAVSRKNVTIIVDGAKKNIITSQHNVEAVLAEAGIRVASEDYLYPAPEEKVRTGSVITVKRAFPVTVLADGQQFEIRVADATVASALAKLGLTLGPLDRVEPSLEQTLTQGDTVCITRVERHFVTRRTEIPYREISRSSEKLDRGTSRIVQEGVTGVREETRLVTLENGVEVSRDLTI